MDKEIALVVTTINAPNKILYKLADGSVKNKLKFIIIGDKKSPSDFKIEGAEFYSLKDQLNLPFNLARSIPVNHYTRKNLGYLLAIKEGIKWIRETDDDNIPLENFWYTPQLFQKANEISNQGWINVYRFFTDKKIWPRGFPLEHVNQERNILSRHSKNICCPLQQGLANQNPDVDAIFRFCFDLPLDFEEADPIYLSNNSMCPFNSQNTVWYKDIFPLLYLPSYCSFRMTDIWRSYVVQRVLWTCGYGVLFHSSTVYQERNEHNLLNDFRDEVPGYLNNSEIMRALMELDLKSGLENISDNMIICYKELIDKGWITDGKELDLVDNWLNDIAKFN